MDVTKNWYRMIEDIIQCPVCLKISDFSYIHCVRGHHICGYCMKELKQCPMCYNNFLPTIINHLVANDLASKLNEIQLSIVEDIKSSTKKLQQEQSVQTDLLITNSSVNMQTDETKLLISAKVSVHTQTSNEYFYSNWGKQIINKTHSYPCLICDDYFKTYQKLEEHLQENHEGNLEKVSLYTENDNSFFVKCRRIFVVACDKLPWECEYVISMKSRTLCFVNFLVRSNGCMKCYVRFIGGSYPSTELSTESYYNITLQTARRLIHKGKVKPYTAKCKMEDIYDICFLKEDILSIIKSTMSFEFTFSLHNCK